MPFGLKNAGAIYHRLVDKAFDRQIGQNLEIYVDDLVIKSHTETKLLHDIEEMFHTLRQINMKLNPKKCTFGAAEGMFLGYMINPKGIKLCPDKTKAVLQLPSPRTIKEVHQKSDFHWTPDAEQAFKELKQHIAELPVLGHNLDTGLFCEPSAAGSRAKLYPNGKASPGAGLCNQKVTQILPGASHRGHHRPAYQARKILADFLVEKPNDAPPEASVIETSQELWTLFMDGSSCVDGSSAGLILTSPEGTESTYALRFQFTTSNTEAEYEVLIAGLRIAAQMGVHNVHVSVDSKLVANQVLGTYVAKEENMIKYLEKTKSLINGFVNFSISQVPRNKNKKADALSKIASTSIAHLSKQVFVEILKEKSIQEKEMATVVEEEGPTEGNRSLGEGIKARLEIRMPTYRTAVVDAVHNDEELWLNLDLLEERHERAIIREAKAKSKMSPCLSPSLIPLAIPSDTTSANTCLSSVDSAHFMTAKRRPCLITHRRPAIAISI
nr:hypothetical protein [Tanacetum cinerariifolium]